MTDPFYFTCPTDRRWPDDIVGCGHTFTATPDDEGLVDCPKCGMWFKPDDAERSRERRATGGNILMRCADEPDWPYRVFTPDARSEEGLALDWTCAHCGWMQTSLAAGCNELCLSAHWHSKDLYAQFRDEARAGGFDVPGEPPMYEPSLGERYDRAIAALQGHSEHGVNDAELIAATGELCRVLHDRFSRDGEYRGGSDGADAVERLCDGFDALEAAADPLRR